MIWNFVIFQENPSIHPSIHPDTFNHTFQSASFTVWEFQEGSEHLNMYLQSLAQKLNSNKEFSLDDSFIVESTFTQTPGPGSGRGNGQILVLIHWSMIENLDGKHNNMVDKVESCRRINGTDWRYMDTVGPEDRRMFKEKVKVPVAWGLVNNRNLYDIWNEDHLWNNKQTWWLDLLKFWWSRD